MLSPTLLTFLALTSPAWQWFLTLLAFCFLTHETPSILWLTMLLRSIKTFHFVFSLHLFISSALHPKVITTANTQRGSRYKIQGISIILHLYSSNQQKADQTFNLISSPSLVLTCYNNLILSLALLVCTPISSFLHPFFSAEMDTTGRPPSRTSHVDILLFTKIV